MLTREGCARRQRRLQQQLEALGCDLFVTGDNRAVYYFTGSFSEDGSPTVFALWQDGSTVLATPSGGEALAGEIRRVETYSIQRAITHPWQDAARLFADALPCDKPARRAAIDRAGCPWLLEDAVRGGEIVDAAEMMLSLRKRKEEDEISEIRASLHLCGAAYRAARETITPGLTEIDIYNSMHAAINREAGTSVLFPGDFACGERGIKEGGPPTRRVIQPQDLYILDLFPAPAFTFAAGAPTDPQYRAWELVCEAIRMAEGAIRPGVYAREVYAQVKEFLDGYELTRSTFWHHAGHGIGYRGHEAPRIIPGCGDVFEVGDVLTLEPGVYSTALQGGIRIEDNYVVRENGLENLFSSVPRHL
jgi:Xaa-Pro aminopeptidase